MVFRQLEHTADLQLEVVAEDLDHLFAEALLGLSDCVTEIGRLRPLETRRIEASAVDRERLLVEWLDEALYLFETERLLFRRARATVEETAAGFRVTGEAAGERFDPEHHPFKVAVKGITYHQLEVGPHGPGFRARVVLDI